MNTENFWKRVIAQIKAHKITQEKFAEYLNIPRSTFYDWLRFNTAPDVFTAYNMATVLGVSLEYLICGEDKRNEKIRMEQTETRKTTESRVKILVEKLQEEIQKF